MNRPDPARFAAARARFEELAELEPGPRALALAALAGRDPDLAAAVTELLAADASAGEEFLAGGAAGLDPEAVGEALAAAEPRGAGAGTGDRVGPYRLRALLGRGGMGEVWEAERADGQFDQVVALKLLKLGMDSEEVLRRFLRERQILARLEHPNIARLLDGGLAPDGRPYLVLERVDGEPIVEWCRSRQSDLAARLRLVIAVADAVDLAHRNLVVHRDLKPSNLLVDASGTVKLLDFGIAKILTGEGAPGDSTRLEDRALTPAYAAPEQILGRPATTSTDVFSLGVVLYELLTGRLPHARATTSHLGLVQEVERETLTRPSRVVAEAGNPRAARLLAGDLDTIVVKALAPEPDRRYGSISAFADDLRRYLDGRPVRARPDSNLYRAQKFVTRHRLAVVAAALVVAALFAGLSLALWQARRAERAATTALAQAARAEQVRAFLVSIFEAADPARARGEKVEVRTLLDEGARRIDSELARQKDLHSELLELLAGLYRKLGELEPAKGLAERSLAERVALYGEESAVTARSEWTLGWVLSNQGDFALARARLEHAIAVLDREEGPQSLAAADAREPLMELLFGAEGPRGALPVVERRLATYRSVLGERDVRTMLSVGDLGVVLNELGRVAEAEQAYRESAATLDAILPPDDPRAAYPHNNLAGLLREAGKLGEAEVEARRALAIRRKSLGERHPDYASTLGQLGRILSDGDRLDEGEVIVREGLAITETVDRFGAAQFRALLANILLKQGKSAEALTLFDECVVEHRTLLPPDHILTFSVEINRARALARLGRSAEAVEVAKRLAPPLRAKGAEAAGVLEVLVAFAHTLGVEV
ncbi:MAG: protein kinase [Thermoanaerobaculia bacterium]